jgi:hypothetical protein
VGCTAMERIFPETFKYASPVVRDEMNRYLSWLYVLPHVPDVESEMHRRFDGVLEAAKAQSASCANPWNVCQPCVAGFNGRESNARVCPWNVCQPCEQAGAYFP